MRFSLLDRLIVSAPILIPLVISLGVVIGIIPPGLGFPWTFALILAITLSVGMVAVLWSISRLKQPQRETSQYSLAEVTRRARRKGVMLISMSFIGVLFSFFLLGATQVKNWLGAFFFLAGVLACVFGAIQARHLKATLRREIATRKDMSLHDLKVLSRFYVDRRVVILAGQALAAISSILFYLYLGGNRYISIWDVIGFLFFLGSFCFWYLTFGQYIRSSIEASKSN